MKKRKSLLGLLLVLTLVMNVTYVYAWNDTYEDDYYQDDDVGYEDNTYYITNGINDYSDYYANLDKNNVEETKKVGDDCFNVSVRLGYSWIDENGERQTSETPPPDWGKHSSYDDDDEEDEEDEDEYDPYNKPYVKKKFSGKDKINVTAKDFEKYVYIGEDGRKTFKYTGTGDEFIIIPDGVEVIRGFTDNPRVVWNDDITYIYIPASVKTCVVSAFMRNDDEQYSCFYRCRNLAKIEVESCSQWYFRANKKGTSLYQPGKIFTWKKNKKVVYNIQNYIDFNERH